MSLEEEKKSTDVTVKKRYLVVGFSQNGKTTLINSVRKPGQEEGATGRPGQGLSCMTQIQEFTCQHPNIQDGQEFSLIDTIGLGDTLLRSKRAIQETIVKTLTALGITVLDGIIVPEALINSTTNIPHVMDFLAVMFGTKTVYDSTVVVVTKSNAVLIPQEKEERMKTINKMKKKFSFKGPVEIVTAYQHYPKERIYNYDGKFCELDSELSSLPPINFSQLVDNIMAEINRLAKEIQEKETTEKTVEYDEGYVDIETKTVKKEVPAGGWNVNLLFVGFGGTSTKTIEEEQQVPIAKTRTSTQTMKNIPEWDYCLL